MSNIRNTYKPSMRCWGLVLTSFLVLLSTRGMATSDLWSDPVRLTHVGPDLNRNYDAREASSAHNSNRNEILLVWEGTDNVPGVAADEAEIYGQRINPQTNTPIGSKFRISFTGTAGDARYDARNPDVAYNAITNEYLVVWYADDNKSGVVEGEFEIYGQRIDGDTGNLLGTAFRISDMGPTGNRSYDAIDPAVAWNSVNNNYLVVWRGEDGTAGTPVGEFEIYAQLLDGNNPAQQLGVNDRRISDMGPDGSTNFDAYSPELTYNATNNEFLVVWYGDDNINGRVSGEFEIYAQRLDGATGAEVGANDFPVSQTGPDGDIRRAAQYPDVAWNADTNEYLVVWSADETAGLPVGNEFEIYAQRLKADGTAVGPDDFRVSAMGPESNNNFDAFRPHVAYHRAGKQFVVVWRGDDTVDGEFEVYAQRLDGKSPQVPLGTIGYRLSHAGPDNNLLYDARRVHITENITDGTVFVSWEQEDNSADQTEGEFEIFAATLSAHDFVFNDGVTGSWYDPNHDGEGWMIERLPGDGVLAVWYTYRPDAPVQAWLVATGHVVNNRVVLDATQITSGGQFGPGFDPNTVVRTDWGGYAIEFDNCTNGQASYASQLPGFGQGHLGQVKRLTTVAGLNCTTPGASSDPYAGITGAWFDPSHNGEGWVLEYLGNNTLLMAWFSYDGLGNQRWFLGIGNGQNGVFEFPDVQTTSGTVFGPAFDPTAVQRTFWGTVTMTVNSCNSVTVDYQGPAEFGSGQLVAVPIAPVAGLACNL